MHACKKRKMLKNIVQNVGKGAKVDVSDISFAVWSRCLDDCPVDVTVHLLVSLIGVFAIREMSAVWCDGRRK